MGAERTALLILGMHRSATDAMAKMLGMLGMLGCDLPRMPHATEPYGAGEAGDSCSIFGFNEKMLGRIGSSWQDWLPVNAGWYDSPPYATEVARGVNIVDAEIGESSLFVLADPQICRLERYWLDVLAAARVAPTVILMVRNPIEVAKSLRQSDGIETGYAYLLWLRHVLEAEAATRGHPRMTCIYSQLVGGWQMLSDRMARTFGLSWPRQSPQVNAEISAFLDDDDPYRHVFSDSLIETDPSLPEWLRSSFAIMARWADKGEDERDYEALDAVRRAFDAVAPAFSGWIIASGRASGEMAVSRERLRETQQQVERLEALADERDVRFSDERSQLERSLQEANDEASTLAEEVARLHHRLAETESRLRQTREEAAQTWSQLEEERKRAAHDVQEIEGGYARLEEKLAVSEAWVFRVAADRADAEAEVRRIKSMLLSVERERDAARARAEQLRHQRIESDRALRHAHDAQMVALRESLETGGSKLHAVEKRAATLFENKSKIEKQFNERHDEMAAITRLLAESEAAEMRRQQEADWLIAISLILIGKPGWWSILPIALQRRLVHRRARRKGLFDAQAYVLRYPDVASTGMDPLAHYIRHGLHEHRMNGFES